MHIVHLYNMADNSVVDTYDKYLVVGILFTTENNKENEFIKQLNI